MPCSQAGPRFWKAWFSCMSGLVMALGRYSEDHSQTCNPLVKHKQAQASQASTREVGCTSAGWEIYDASV